jgi:epoxyqueuosine reductase
MSLTRIIKEKALELGYVAAGIATLEPFALYGEELAGRPEMYEWGKSISRHTSLQDFDLTKFIDPARVFPEVKSLVVATDSYFEEDFPPSLAGKIGRCYLKGLFCREETTHSRRRKEFRKSMQAMGLKVSSGPVPARMAGARAGVTNYGKNCFVFANEAAGKSSWIVNETFLVDRELIPDEPSMKVNCPDNCRKCIDACPTGALYAPLKMDPRKCIAWHSFFNGGEIPADLRSKMGTWVYGCDLCQEGCPRNKKWLEKKKPMNQRLAERAADFQISLLLAMSQEHYEQRVWPLLFYIRQENRKLWQRNAAVALGNQGDPESVSLLAAALDDPEPLVRGHVAWALGKIGGGKAASALEKIRNSEPDEKVRKEIEQALAYNP